MSAYTPDPTNPNEPTDSRYAKFAAAEIRAFKAYVAGLLGLSVPNPFPAITVPSLNGGQLAGMRNKIINGKMEVAQRGTSFVNVNNAYTLDRWITQKVTTAIFDVTQNADVPASAPEFQFSHRLTVTTADAAIAAGDYTFTLQGIEGYNVRDLIGRTFTLSFWVRSAKTGVHCIALRNSGSDRSYVAEYTVLAANTWERKTIAVTNGLITAGTWNWTTGIGVQLSFALACGTTFQTTPGAWQTGNFLATANQVNCLDTIGNIFALTGVQLECGSAATSFEHRPYGTELQLCQRYFEIIGDSTTNYPNLAGYGGAGIAATWTHPFSTSKRVVPTLTKNGVWSVSNCSQPTAGNASVSGFNITAVCTALGAYQTFPNTADDNITASAEF